MLVKLKSKPNPYKATPTMTATLWIHRACCTDLLIRFPSAFEGYNFGCRFLKEYYEDNTAIHSWDETSYTESTYFNVGDSPSLQLSVHDGEFHSDGWIGLDNWADETFIVNPEEAMTLGDTGIPSEESVPLLWTKDSAFAEGTTRYGGPIVWPYWVKPVDSEIDPSDE